MQTAQICASWRRGHGCDRSKCALPDAAHPQDQHHLYRNTCHRWERDESCRTYPCFRLHPRRDPSVPYRFHRPTGDPQQSTFPPTRPSPTTTTASSSSSSTDNHNLIDCGKMFLQAVQITIRSQPPHQQKHLTMQFLRMLHPDRNPDPAMQQLLKDTVTWLTALKATYD